MPDIYIFFLASTGGSPPFISDSITPTNTNEPYLDWLNFILAQETIPQVITTSYGDDEQTVCPLEFWLEVGPTYNTTRSGSKGLRRQSLQYVCSTRLPWDYSFFLQW